MLGSWVGEPVGRADDLGRPPGRALLPDARQHESLATTSTRAGRRPSASGSTSRRPTTARPRASTSAASRWRARRSPATSATRTRGGSAPTKRRRPGFFDGPSTTSGSTTARSAPPRSQTDMASRIQQETTPPVVTAFTPATAPQGSTPGTKPTVTFNEPMQASTITTTTFQLKDAGEAVVPATVTYNAATRTATLTPQARWRTARRYTVTVKGGAGGVTDTSGNTLAANVSWSFSTEASPPQLLVVTSTARPFGSYLGEILQERGPERVHDDRRRLPLTGAAQRLRRRPARRRRADPGAGLDADGLGRGRRQPDRDAARQAARRTARAHRQRRPRGRTPTSRSTPPSRRAPGSPAPRSSTTAPRTTTR